MRQRAMIAMALACEPKLLIADEPTTALDVTIQAQILDLLRTLVAESDTALILITHDLGVVAGMCERVAVMYGGMFMETGSTEQIFDAAAASVHARPAAVDPAPRPGRARRKLHPIEGTPPHLLQAADGVPVRAALRVRGRPSRGSEVPPLREVEPGHRVACFNPVPADEWARAREAVA